MTRKKNH